MKISRLLIVTLSLIVALSIVGCGRGLGESPATTTPAPTPTPTPPAPPPPPPPIASVQHIILAMQENRSFDHYFGHLGIYRAAHGFGQVADIDGMPANASNPDPNGVPVQNFHLKTMCMENLTPDWLESHGDYNLSDLDFPPNGYKGNGFVSNAAGLAQCCDPQPSFDNRGVRAIGWYDDSDLPYDYFMASNFATSDRFFSPLPANSVPNRVFGMAATTASFIHADMPDINTPTIFSLLDKAGITWRYYYITTTNGHPNTTLNNFFPTFANAHSANIVPVSQYFTDAANNNLAQVSYIQEQDGLDEHPGGNLAGTTTGNDIQYGAALIKKYVDALMASQAWTTSVFFLTFDEGGGFYDHVQPQATVSPDGIPPCENDSQNSHPGCLETKDQQAINPPLGYTGNGFDVTGYRVPLIVISPFANKSYVSHTPMDYTAFLKFIETRFNLSNLTARDAAQPDMQEFFNFQTPPWLAPPTPPAQPTNGICNLTNLPE